MLRAAEPDSTRQKLIHRVGIDLFPGYVLPTHDFFKGTNRQGEPVNTTMSAHLKWAFQFAPDSYFGRNYPYASQGIGVAYNTFFNGKEVVALPVIEIVTDHEFFDYDAKYNGCSEEICPARLSDGLTTQIQEASKKIYARLGCSGVVRVDYILSGEDL